MDHARITAWPNRTRDECRIRTRDGSGLNGRTDNKDKNEQREPSHDAPSSFWCVR
jgi:hypothetical protein